jgi:GH15 family glucan-1,4-alpha-glucosidase
MKLSFFIPAFITILLYSFSVFTASLPDSIFFKNNVISNVKLNLEENITTRTNQFPKATYPNFSKKSIPGSVIAAPPNTKHPGDQKSKSGYMYSWARDTGVVMMVINDLFNKAVDSKDQPNINKYGQYMLNYINWLTYISKQKNYTPGITRFYLSGQPDLTWINPQFDGPAIRSIVLIEFADTLINKSPNINDSKYGKEYVTTILYSKKNHGLIRDYLNYIQSNYKKSNYDLWESCKGNHFFTEMVQLKSLILGAALASKLNEKNNAESYLNTSLKLSQLIIQHWGEFNYKNKIYECYREGSNISSKLVFPMHPNYPYNKYLKYRGMGLNSSILLGVLYGNLYDISQKSSWVYAELTKNKKISSTFLKIIKTARGNFFPSSNKVQKTVALLTEAFKSNGMDPYKINKNTERDIALLGRYPGDLYTGTTWNNPDNFGNPWFICSTALAQYYYILAKELNKHEYILKGNSVMNMVFKYVDNKTNSSKKKYTMSEQINRTTGIQSSFHNLTWSYAQYLLTYFAYKNTAQ